MPSMTISPGNCGTQTVAGGDTGIQQTFNLGKSPASFTFSWNTYGIPDRVIVYHDGAVLFDSQCNGSDLPPPNNAGAGVQNLSFSGGSTNVVVQVSPNCNGDSGTAWDFTVGCPP
jgi:hypothetical protein